MTVHIGLRTYVTVFVLLLVLTGVTVMAAFVHMGRLNDVVALTIAVTKATLVLLYFMHLRHSSVLSRLTVLAGVAWLLILMVLTMSDVLTRDWITFPAT